MERNLNSVALERTPVLCIPQIFKAKLPNLIRQKVDIRLLALKVNSRGLAESWLKKVPMKMIAINNKYYKLT
jgi:hypothetical protein